MPIERTREEVADAIEQFLDGKSGKWDWDDFCSFEIVDPELDAIRIQCVNLRDEYPSQQGYCSDAGYEIMRRFARTLRSDCGADGPSSE